VPRRRGVADGSHIFERMHARQLLIGSQRRFVAREPRREARRDQLVLDGGEPLGALGMVRPHVVLQAVGVRDKSNSRRG